MVPPLKLLAAAAAFLFVFPAGAQPAESTGAPAVARCPLQPAYPLPAARAELQDLARRLDALAAHPDCLPDAYFHAWRGSVLLAAGEPASAIEPLERALLTQPDLPAAQIDLALALSAIGDVNSAMALLEQLQGRQDLPEPLRLALERQRANLADVRANRLGWQSRLQVSSLLGADSNLNNAPSATELTLTFPQGNVTLPLAPTALERRGAAWLNTAQWIGLKPSGDALWMLQGELRARRTGESDTAYEQADLVATWLQAPDAPRQWVLRAAASHLRFGGRSLVSTSRLSAQYQWPKLVAPRLVAASQALGNCRPAAGLEIDHRRYPVTRELDGIQYGGVVGLQCVSGSPQPSSVLGLQVRVSHDRPERAERPGGSQDRGEVRVQWETPLRSPLPGTLGPGRFSLQWASAWQKDATGYSALLDNGAIRHIRRHGFQAEAAFALGGGLSLVVSGEASRQRSSLAAFTASQKAIYLGLRWDLM